MATNDLPDMTRAARRSRAEAWQAGWDWAKSREIDAQTMATTAESIEYLRGIGQYFTAQAHDLTRDQQPDIRQS